MVTLRVGKDDVEFVIHKKFLCDRVPYFDKMSSSPWKESKEHAATFPWDSAEAFDINISWVYMGAIR